MGKRIEVLEEYKIFGSCLRGTPEVEEKINTIINAKETPDNINALASSMQVEWRSTDKNVSALALAFSKFERKFEEQKQNMITAIQNKDLEKPSAGSEYLFSKTGSELI